eukprot:8971270-Karenia_brevis.AAC.1
MDDGRAPKLLYELQQLESEVQQVHIAHGSIAVGQGAALRAEQSTNITTPPHGTQAAHRAEESISITTSPPGTHGPPATGKRVARRKGGKSSKQAAKAKLPPTSRPRAN